MSASVYHPVARGYNPTPSPGSEAMIGWKSTADGNGVLVYIAGGVAVPVTVLTPDLSLIRSDKDVDFTGSIAVGDMATTNLTGLPANSGIIESLTVLSDQNLAWDLALFTKDTFTNSDLDLDTFLASVRFSRLDGRQINAVGPYRYDTFGLAMPYRDQDGTSELHLGLVNRGPTSKNAGASGEVVVVVGFRPDD